MRRDQEGSGDDANNAKLLAELRNVPPENRGARFRCVAVYVRSADDPSPIIAEGVWEGRIAPHCLGHGGFGYDPLFIDTESGLTGGQLTAEQKNLRSHRSRAVAHLRDALNAASSTRRR